jgi:hypothetical protein
MRRLPFEQVVLKPLPPPADAFESEPRPRTETGARKQLRNR